MTNPKIEKFQKDYENSMKYVNEMAGESIATSDVEELVMMHDFMSLANSAMDLFADLAEKIYNLDTKIDGLESQLRKLESK